MASAEDLPRPEPLPLVDAMPHRRPSRTATSPTPRCSAPRSPARASPIPTSRPSSVDAPEAAAATAPPEWLADDLVVETRRRQAVAAPLALRDPRRRCSRCWWAGARPSPTRSSAPRATRSPTSRAQTQAAATAAAEELGFEVEIAESREDGSTPGTVLDTRPPAGEQLDEGETLTLIISLGNTPAPVPTDLVGKTLEEATQLLTDAGGFKPEVTEQESEDVPDGRRHRGRRRGAGRAAQGRSGAARRVERPGAAHRAVGPGGRLVRRTPRRPSRASSSRPSRSTSSATTSRRAR